MRVIYCFIFLLFFIYETSGQAKFTSPVRDTSFTIDSLYYLYAKEGFYTVVDDVQYLQNYLISLDRNSQLAELDRLKKAAKKYKCEGLMKEHGYFEEILYPNISEYDEEKEIYISPNLERNIKSYRKYIDKASDSGDILFKLRMMQWMLHVCYYDVTNSKYAQAFELSRFFLKELDEVSLDIYPMRSFSYYTIAELYCKFDDYEKALPIIEKALQETPYYFDYGSAAAHNTLGLYYMESNTDLSEKHFQTILEIEKDYTRKEEYSAIANSNLARMLYKQGKYSEALRMFPASIVPSMKENDVIFVSGIFTNMGNCYLKIGNLEMTKNMIDSSLYYIRCENYKRHSYYTRIYTLMSKYYASINQELNSHLYLDSAFMSDERQKNIFNYSSLLKAEQMIFEYEQQMKDKELSYKTNLLILLIVLLLIVAIFLGVVLFLYRKKKGSLRSLSSKKSILGF
ncbi:hypothetical protein LJB98_02265 [Bacteroidales bacterium OttesenSCG-928-M11]|nr:hypothetical protein [Bacteroidales bacterium OttesenSCG-928-M11]